MDETLRLKTVANDEYFAHVKELLDAGHSVTFVVRGNSMNPFLSDRRDRVCLVSCPAGRPLRGDFVLAYEASARRYVLHRVVGCEGNGDFLLRGDGNLRATERIAPHDLLGLVSAVERKGRWYPTDSLPWRLYSALWMRLLPLRRWLLAAWRRL